MTRAVPFVPSRGVLERVLSLFAPVKEGEGAGALLLAANIFLLLGTYYLLKTVREPLILSQPGGAEMKSYATAAQAGLFLLVVPIYWAVASRFNRVRLITVVSLFFISNLAIFFALGREGMNIGVAFYLWVGVFNMLVVAQFWSFANDIYTEEQGKRLFPIVGVGASLGASVGAFAAKWLFGFMTAPELMGLSAVLLLGCIGMTWAVHQREKGRASVERARQAELPVDRKGGLQVILQSRYLLMIAAVILLLNCVNSTGEYIVSHFVTDLAHSLPAKEQGKFIGQFYGDYFTWVNLLGFAIQMLLVARLFQWIGVRGAMFVLPCIALGGYGMLAIAPIISIVRVAKIFENSVDYSLNNTVRHALFLPTSREAKYKAKAAIDTFFVRFGDVVSAGIVYAGTTWLGFHPRGFAVVNLLLVATWIAISVAIYREHKRLTSE